MHKPAPHLLRTLAGGLVAVVVASSGGDALAQKAKYNRDSAVKIEVGKDADKLKPIKPNAKAAEAAPSVTSDQMLNIGQAVSSINDDQAFILQELIDETPDSEVEEKAKMLFQMADLRAKQNRTWRLASTEAEIKYGAAKSKGDKDKYKKAWDEAKKKAESTLIAAIQAYRALIGNPVGKSKFKKFGEMDKALFYYAFMLQQSKVAGGIDKAREAFDVLIKDHPNSQFIPEAHLAFAEYHFEKGDLALAEDRYNRVLAFPKSPIYWYAFYKQGWVQLNLANHKKALDIFYKVAIETKGDPKQELLNKASKKDIVRAYAEAGDVKIALRYFQKVDKSYAFTMYEMLADLYLADGKTEKAVHAYRELMSEQPKAKNVCLWQYNIARSMMGAGSTPAQKVGEIENLVRLWGALRDNKTLPAAEADECHDNAADMSGELARAYHSESVTTKNGETLAHADKLYNVYLKVFPDADDFAVTQYYYAELLWTRALYEKNARLQTELWENAAIEFTNVVKNGKVEEKIKKEAAKAAVLGWKNALDVDPRVKEGAAPEDAKAFDKVPEPLPIPEREGKMLAAFDIYINYIDDKKDPELVGMKFLKANMYRRYNRFDDAMPIFEDILKNHREHETALYSANLLLDSLNRLKRYDQMLKWVDVLIADDKWLEDKDDLRASLETLKRQSLRKQAEALEDDAQKTKDFGKYVACGKAYTDIYNRASEQSGGDPEKMPDDADVILYNAAVCFEEGKSVGQAIQMYKTLESDYPSSKQTARALLRLGSAYARVGFYDQAAVYLSKYGLTYSGEELAKNAVNDAVFYLKGIGQDDEAIAKTKQFIGKWGSKGKDGAADAAGAFFSLYTIYEKRGDDDMLIKHLRQYIAQHAKAGGADKLIMAYAKIGQTLWEKSCGTKTVEGSCVRVIRERAVSSRQKGKRKRTVQTQCGPADKVKVSVVARDPRLVKDALAAFGKAISEFEARKGATGGDEAAAQYWYATAKFALAEKDYEAFLGQAFPTGLNFDPANKAVAAKSLEKFNSFFNKKLETRAAVIAKYQGVIATKDAANAIAAAARVGQIEQNITDVLYTAEIPENIRKYDEAVEAYCDVLTQKAEPLEVNSINAFRICLGKSTELGYFSQWSRMCEKELGQIQPDQFPTARELRGEPTQVGPIRDVEPAVLKLAE